jgi:uncharacterized NAD(P)/FAD-binding protein YdhS
VRIAIVGGGYTGAAAAVQLARAAADTASITIVEPRAELGRGMAYSSTDPDHRLNAPLDNHLVDPAAPDELRQWCERNALFARDPEALAPNGAIYLRRSDFGTYMDELVRAESVGGARIRHHRARATGLAFSGNGIEIRTSDGAIEANLVVVATGNGAAQLPAAFATLPGHPALVPDPFDSGWLRTLPRAAPVLLVGTGLTALDVISSLSRAGHTGRITALSRHGLRPRPPRSRMSESVLSNILGRIAGDPPEYARSIPTAHGLSKALRARIAETVAAGGEWQVPFDELRDSVWRIWPRLPLAERRRFLRHLRAWYDAHRFRAPPQNAAIAAAVEREGRLAFRKGRLREARASGEGRVDVRWAEAGGRSVEARFAAVVNCSGLDPAGGAATNPFLADLLAQGLLRADPTGLGFEVDGECRPIGRNGVAVRGLRVIGPPTLGSCGDPLGAIFIAPQVCRVLPGLLADCASIRHG